jgi:hypothetical protein
MSAAEGDESEHTARDSVLSIAERVVIGVSRLDEILRGGLLKGGTYAVIGPPAAARPSWGTSSASTTPLATTDVVSISRCWSSPTPS